MRIYLGSASAGLGTMQQVVSTITSTESARPQLNNPGNLIYVGQAGASPSSYSFVGSDGKTYYLAQFDTPEDGEAALENQINLDAARGMTISQFTQSYAPAGSGNDPASYAQYIAGATGLSVDDSLANALSTGAGAGAGAGAADTGLDLSALTGAGVGDAGVSVDYTPWIMGAGLALLFLFAARA